VTRLAALVPGYATVARVSEVLHLAPRSVRDLIYSGRLPSLRLGRLHYIKASDLELERRRRLGLPLPRRGPRSAHPRPRPVQLTKPAPRQTGESAAPRPHADPAARRQRAAERSALVSRWLQRHGNAEPRLPATVLSVTEPINCEVCAREIRRGRMIEFSTDSGQTGSHLCLTCGRRALLDWADRRRQEAAAARRLSESLGEPQPEAVPSLVA
jgi:hypothetical protein